MIVSRRYETWSPIGCVPGCVIGCSKYGMGNSPHAMHYGLTWPVGISTVFKGYWQSPCTALTAGKRLPLGLCKETVKQSSSLAAVAIKNISPECVLNYTLAKSHLYINFSMHNFPSHFKILRGAQQYHYSALYKIWKWCGNCEIRYGQKEILRKLSK